MGQTSLISYFDNGTYYYFYSSVFFARPHVEASLWDGLINHTNIEPAIFLKILAGLRVQEVLCFDNTFPSIIHLPLA